MKGNNDVKFASLMIYEELCLFECVEDITKVVQLIRQTAKDEDKTIDAVLKEALQLSSDSYVRKFVNNDLSSFNTVRLVYKLRDVYDEVYRTIGMDENYSSVPLPFFLMGKSAENYVEELKDSWHTSPYSFTYFPGKIYYKEQMGNAADYPGPEKIDILDAMYDASFNLFCLNLYADITNLGQSDEEAKNNARILKMICDLNNTNYFEILEGGFIEIALDSDNQKAMMKEYGFIITKANRIRYIFDDLGSYPPESNKEVNRDFLKEEIRKIRRNAVR